MHLPDSPPDISAILGDPKLLRTLLASKTLGAEVDGHYLVWDELRHRVPPQGLSVKEWWASLSIARQLLSRPLPITDGQDRPFTMVLGDEVQGLLHHVDRDLGGRIERPSHLDSPEVRDRYIMSGLIEEAIMSSQLEGASTTRRVAKEMLRSGRTPTTVSERMILNNFRAMEWVSQRGSQPLTPSLVLELHAVITQGTLPAADVGRLRRADEVIQVVDNADGTILHVPPAAGLLPARLELLCRFANGELASHFIHPVIRAILLHFWLAYDHPFVDGNGRAARALFYASLHGSHEYWLAPFLSISRVLKKAPGQYARAFLHSEIGTNDVTYFLIHQLRVIDASVQDMLAYVQRKLSEMRDAERHLGLGNLLNHRQRALLSHAMLHPKSHYTIDAHRRSHNVVYQTARSDLLDLCKRGYLRQRRVGKRFVFEVTAKVGKGARPARAKAVKK